MKARGCQEDLLGVARRLIWWKPPAVALEDRPRFLAQVMVLGTWNDVAVTRLHCSDEDLRKVLRAPPPGVFDPRSWSYWHRMLDEPCVPPMPRRDLP